MHNTTIETQKRGKTAMQIKITVDIENTDILKFFELFKKDLATVAKNTTVETVEDKNDSADISEEKPQKKESSLKTTVPILAEYRKPRKNQIIPLIIPWRMILILMRLRLTPKLKLLKTSLYQWQKTAEKQKQKIF